MVDIQFMDKPFSQACENNKRPILEVLQRWLKNGDSILEVGSGTGQHAVFFGEELPELKWQTADMEINHAGILAWLESAWAVDTCRQVMPPVELSACGNWPDREFDAVYSANTFHIMGWSDVECFFPNAGKALKPGGYLLVYGPFNYSGQFTSESNRAFDSWLRGQHPRQGIRDFEAVCELALQSGLDFIEDNAMPANNRTLVWQKSGSL
jgi:cyclopropane fatty-acyl-phospholipid synthase-like methyltransferase